MSSSKIRLVQAGMGGMGRAWWKSVVRNSPDFSLVAIVDVVDAPLSESGDELGIPADRRFKSLQAALDAVEADAVLTVTPPPIHVEHAKLAFARGLHLLTEKPIAHDLANAKLMVDLARKAGKQLLVAQNYRYSPAMQRLKKLFDEKPVGEFGHGHIDFYIPADFTGSFRETMEYPLLVDMAIHHMDLIRFVTGRNITRVTAHTFKPAWSWYQHHPGLKMLLELEGGLPFSYSGDWSAIGKPTSWNGMWRLQCASGSLHLDESNAISVARCEKWSKNPTSEPVDAPELPLSGQAAILKNFADAIRSGRPGETSGIDNLWSFGAVIAGVMSTQQGRTIDVADLIRI
ncbi:MAG TPA: Gfo/Idh/MocA family oxidoreductase [Tepidisphaeraceae bacterium]|jgi:predicted dehydrogenase